MSHSKSTAKIIVTPTADMRKTTEDFAKLVATKLGVCPEDVIVLPGGVASLTFAAIPAELIEAKEKADADAKAKADAAAKAEAEAANVAAAKERAEAALKAKAEAEKAKEIEAAAKAELAKQHAAEAKTSK